jgi:hypothetical protein
LGELGGGQIQSRTEPDASGVAVSREHRRPKTHRLDVELLKRALLGWLRGERGHCKMAAIPTLELEDARRPNRERETLVGECTRILNRMKSTLTRLGIRNFKPNLRKAPERLGALRTPEGVALPANTMAELRPDSRQPASVGFVRGQQSEGPKTVAAAHGPLRAAARPASACFRPMYGVQGPCRFPARKSGSQ